MFHLRKLHPPFGTADAPLLESSYSEGLVNVVNGLCQVQQVETRDRLLKMGYEEVEAASPTANGNGGRASARRTAIRRSPRRRR